MVHYALCKLHIPPSLAYHVQEVYHLEIPQARLEQTMHRKLKRHEVALLYVCSGEVSIFVSSTQHYTKFKDTNVLLKRCMVLHLTCHWKHQLNEVVGEGIFSLQIIRLSIKYTFTTEPIRSFLPFLLHFFAHLNISSFLLLLSTIFSLLLL